MPLMREGAVASIRVKPFRNGRNQAVRIPVEFELPGNEAIMRRDGDRLILEPGRSRGFIALIRSWEPLAKDDAMPSIADPRTEPEDIS